MLEEADMKQARKILFKTFIGPHHIPTPFECPGCGEKAVEQITVLLAGPYSGRLECTKCGWTEGTMSFIGNSICSVQPMPAGALPIY